MSVAVRGSAADGRVPANVASSAARGLCTSRAVATAAVGAVVAGADGLSPCCCPKASLPGSARLGADAGRARREPKAAAAGAEAAGPGRAGVGVRAALCGRMLARSLSHPWLDRASSSTHDLSTASRTAEPVAAAASPSSDSLYTSSANLALRARYSSTKGDRRTPAAPAPATATTQPRGPLSVPWPCLPPGWVCVARSGRLAGSVRGLSAASPAAPCLTGLPLSVSPRTTRGWPGAGGDRRWTPSHSRSYSSRSTEYSSTSASVSRQAVAYCWFISCRRSPLPAGAPAVASAMLAPAQDGGRYPVGRKRGVKPDLVRK
eukprot:scaffold25830_cov101-Isochrysis_galbana.AAC.4